MVGTMCVWVTACSSIRTRAWWASQLSIITTVAPNACGMLSEKARGAAW